MLENSGISGIFVLQKGISSVASQSQESEKHRLENTVWNPLGNTF